MSSEIDSPVTPAELARYGRWIKNILATLGLLLLAGAVVMYIQGWLVLQEFDPKAAQVIGDFARKALKTDIATASTVRMPLAEGVSFDEAIESMERRAAEYGMALAGRLAIGKSIAERTGGSFPRVEVFQFCDPATAAKVLRYNWDFVVHMPCRIALFEDDDGRAWLATMNLELLIHGGRNINPTLKPEVVSVKDRLLDIMAAGASGSF